MGRIAEVNQSTTLGLKLYDGATDQFPRARIYNSAGTELTAAPFNSPINLTHRANGFYSATFTPDTEGEYFVVYRTFSDAGYTTLNKKYEEVMELLAVRSLDQDLATLLSRITATRAGYLDNLPRLDVNVSTREADSDALTRYNNVQTKLGTPVGASVSVDIASVKSDTNTLNTTKITTTRANNLDNLDTTITSRLATTTFNTVTGTPVTSVSADIAAVKSDTTSTKSTVDTNLNATVASRATQVSVDAVNTKLGTPAGVSVSADIAAVKSDTSSTKTVVDTNLNATVSSRATQTSVDNINTKLGTPAGASVSVDIAAVKSDTSSTKSVVDTNLNATVASRSTQTSVDAVKAVVDTINIETDTASIAAAVWDRARASHTAVGSFGESNQGVVSTARANNLDNLDATVSSRSTQTSVNSVQADTDDIQAKIGIPSGSSVSADIAAVKSDTGSTKATVDTNLDTTVSSRSTQSSVNAIQTDTDDIQSRIGVPSGASVSADIASVKSDTSGLRTDYTTVRAGNLDNLDTTVSSRATAAAVASVQADTDALQVDTATLLSRLNSARAANLDNLDAAISTRATASALAAVQADTDDIQSKIGVPAGVSVSADIAAVKSVVDTIDTETDTTAIAAAVWNASRASHTAAGSFGQANQGVLSATRADNLDNLDVPVSTRAGSVALASVQSDTGAIKAKTDQLTFSSGNVDARANVVADKTGYLLNSTEHDAIVDKVWDENIAAHTSAGSTGKALNDASMAGSGSLTPAAISSIVDGVWNAPIAAHTLPGTTGQKLEEAGTILPSELEDIAVAVWDSQLVDFNDPGSMGYNMNRIDNIEADMAKAGDTAKQVDLLTVKTVQSNLVSSFSDFRSVYTDLRGAKLDNLDTSVSSRASQGSVTAGFADTAKDTTVAKATQVSAVQTSVNAVQTSVNALQSDVTSVKGSVQSTGVVVSTSSQDSIVDKVWDESAAAHVAPGTMGYDQSVAASGVITPGDISNIAVAVWDESLAAHSVPGSASEIVKTVTAVKTDTTDLLGRLNPTRAANLDNLDAAITSRESEAAASARAANDTLNHNQIISELGDIETKVDTINAKLGTPAPSVGGALSSLAASVASVQAKTNNLPSDPASASGVTAAIAPAIAAATQANATSLAVKAKTDNLPADPAKESSVLAVPTNPVLATDGRLTNLDAPITSRAKPSDLAPLATTAQLVAVESALTSDIAGVALGVAQTAKPSDVAAATSGMALEATSQQIKSTLNSVQGAQITPNDVWTYGARTLTAPVDTTTDLSALATSAQLAAAAAQMTNDLTVWNPKLTVAIQPTTDEITLVAWLTEDGQLVTDADSAEVTVLDSDDNVAFAVGPDMFVSANGLFKFTRANASTVVARNNTYACKIVITKGGNDYVDIVPITVF